MICKCMNCSTALRFSPVSGMLECAACDSSFWASQFEEEENVGEEIEVEVYSCTACGAQLAVNGVESSTFCSYCGQPTIVFDRISSTKKPKYIIPFSVSKEQAVSLIRNYIEEGEFVPKEIKNFEIERVRGIYIPFWLYDVEYADRQYLTGTVGSGKDSHTEYYMRLAETTFYNLTLDASQQLNDGVSQRLEPYDTRGMIPFHSAYLSGFYADCFDYESEQMEGYAIYRCRQLFDQEILKTINAVGIEVDANDPRPRILKSEYAMLPAWFLTFRYENVPYTILVNGQTQKVVGAVPYDKRAVRMRMWIIAILITLVCVPIMRVLLAIDDGEGAEIIFAILGGVVVLWQQGIRIMRKVRDNINRTRESAMNRFVRDRQEG